MNYYKIMITTHPFTKKHRHLLTLEDNGVVVIFNPHKRKMTHKEHKDFLISEQPDIIIAGTEMYNTEVLDLCTNLKLISRVGVGMDSIDLKACTERGIKVTNTPDAPTNAVAELIIGQILTLARRINTSDIKLRMGGWDRYVGREIKNCNVGIIGCGRIGSSVLEKIQSFNPNKIFVHDILEYDVYSKIPKYSNGFIISNKKQILNECDIISIHIPYNEYNRDFISGGELSIMKKNAIIINTSRGGIINETELFNWLTSNLDASAAIDVFNEEPYVGKLSNLTNILLTPHIGSCSKQSRKDMEDHSINNVINFLNYD